MGLVAVLGRSSKDYLNHIVGMWVFGIGRPKRKFGLIFLFNKGFAVFAAAKAFVANNPVTQMRVDDTAVSAVALFSGHEPTPIE